MASGPSASGSGDRTANELESSSEKTAETSCQDLLDQVLQATLSAGLGNDRLESGELQTLHAVARRRRIEPFSVDTATELVQAILRVRFRSLSASRDQWERMTRQIAETMYHDPQTLPRLQSLWALLCEGVV